MHLKALDAKEKARIIKPYVDSLAAKEATLVTLRTKLNTLQTGNQTKQKTIENLRGKIKDMAPAPLRYTQRTCETKLAEFMGVCTPARRSRGNHFVLRKEYDGLAKTHSRELVERDDQIVAVKAVVEDVERKVGDLEDELCQSKMKVDELRGEVQRLEGDNRELRSSRKHDSPRNKRKRNEETPRQYRRSPRLHSSSRSRRRGGEGGMFLSIYVCLMSFTSRY